MEIILEAVKLFLSLGVLIFLGGRLIEAAVRLARGFGVSPTVIGLTLLAYGTSLPEFAVSSIAAVKGHSGISISNIIGSNIYNIGVVMGVVSLIRPFAIEDLLLARRDGVMMLIATALLGLLLFLGGIGRLTGFSMVAAISFYTYYILRHDRTNNGMKSDPGISREREVIIIALLMGGVLISGDISVDAASKLARLAGVTEWVIGATVVAAGTSLPETVVSIMAIRKGETGMSIGNIVGSNTFNILWILGFASMLNPLKIETNPVYADLIFLSLISVLFYIAIAKARLARVEGVLYISIYAGYIYYLLS